MNLVDRDRLVEALPLGSRSAIHSWSFQRKLGDVPDDRGRLGPQLGGEAVGVGLLDEIAVVPALDLVLVDFALAEVGDEDLPDPRRAAVAHRVPAAVPVIEVADHADSLRIRGPDGEVDAAKPSMRPDVGTQPLVIAIVRPFAQQVQVEIGQHRPERVGIDKLPRMPLVVLDPQPIRERAWPAGEDGRRKNHRGGSAPSATRSPGSPRVRSTTQADLRLGQERADDPGLRSAALGGQLMNAQDRERVPVVAMDDQVDVGLRRRRYRHVFTGIVVDSG